MSWIKHACATVRTRCLVRSVASLRRYAQTLSQGKGNLYIVIILTTILTTTRLSCQGDEMSQHGSGQRNELISRGEGCDVYTVSHKEVHVYERLMLTPSLRESMLLVSTSRPALMLAPVILRA